MFERSSLGALVLSASLLACGGSTASGAPAANEPAAGEPAAAEPAAAEPAAAEPASAPAASDAASSEAVSAATSAAEAWLKLVDDAQYDASWTNAASVFRNAVSTEAWSKAAGSVRGQVGKPLSRRLSSANYTTTVPGGPDGKYVIIQYDTSFEKKASAVETVTPMQDSDGTWRVAGYFIK
jgi:pyruvate/2-oxoglutarate dehydrogenase complex dihydrolipoamide acyltransferase (E2) component